MFVGGDFFGLLFLKLIFKKKNRYGKMMNKSYKRCQILIQWKVMGLPTNFYSWVEWETRSIDELRTKWEKLQPKWEVRHKCFGEIVSVWIDKNAIRWLKNLHFAWRKAWIPLILLETYPTKCLVLFLFVYIYIYIHVYTYFCA